MDLKNWLLFLIHINEKLDDGSAEKLTSITSSKTIDGLLVLNKQKIKSYWGSLKSLQYLLFHTLCEFKVIWFRNIKAYFTWIAFLKLACYSKLKGIFIQTILTNFPIAWLVSRFSLLLPTGPRAAEHHGAQHHFVSLSFLFFLANFCRSEALRTIEYKHAETKQRAIVLSGVSFTTVKGRDKKHSFPAKEFRRRKDKLPSLPPGSWRHEYNVCHAEFNSLPSI